LSFVEEEEDYAIEQASKYKQIEMAVAEECSSSRASRWSLKGMTALVTGGTRGIGSVFLLLFFPFCSFLQ
jgi:hypothetical protein